MQVAKHSQQFIVEFSDDSAGPDANMKIDVNDNENARNPDGKKVHGLG
jgi:hypothetical protein